MIKIENISKAYGEKENKVEVLKGIDLNIKDGKLLNLGLKNSEVKEYEL